MTMFSNFKAAWAKFARARGGNVAMVFALSAGALVVATGAGVDMTRSVDMHSELQSITDAAALAGASAYVSSATASTGKTVATNYMNNAIATLPPNSGVSFSVTTGTKTSGGSTTGYTVSVTANTSVGTTLLSMVTGSVPVAVTSAAENPVVTVNMNFNGFQSSAWDNNLIYYYLIPQTGSAIPSGGGQPTGAVLLYNNKNSTPGSPISVTMTASQKVGFALENMTSSRYYNQYYGCNQYETPPSHPQNWQEPCLGETHWYYSELSNPSSIAYPSVTDNRSLQVYLQNTTQGQSVPQEQPYMTFTTPFAAAAPSCSQLKGETAWFYWNDMGGGTDDLDYNDMYYSFSCSGGSTSGGSVSGPTSVVLTQ